MEKNRLLGGIIARLLAHENLSREESYEAFRMVLANEVNDMQQGGFLAALTCKGESAEEVAGGWQAVYELDTNKVDLSDLDIADNCGTGMDSFKTFNISTAASLVAAAAGVKVARHGARAITSTCGTVDMAEMLGVDMECSTDLVAESIREAGIGLFNGMSGQVHPMALGRILSQICFGSPLNIAASLAHPALPKMAVRGVYSKDLLRPVAEVMQNIGYTDAILVHGAIRGSNRSMDEGSVCGTTACIRLKDNTFTEFSFEPEDCGLTCHPPESIAAESERDEAALNMYKLLAGRGANSQIDAVSLNAGLLLQLTGNKEDQDLAESVGQAREILLSGASLGVLEQWVEVQNSDPGAGLSRLQQLSDAEGSL